MMDRCGRCHRGLTAEKSVKRGFGSFCWKKVQKEFEELDKQQPLDGHFETIVTRFILHGKLDENEAEYFRCEAVKAVQKNDKGLAETLAFEAVHLAISDKVSLWQHDMLIQDIRNMFELASAFKESERQERYLKKALSKKYKMIREVNS